MTQKLERLRCEVCDIPTLGDTLCNLHYEEQEAMSTHTDGPWSIQIRKDGLGCSPCRNSIEIVHNYPNGGGQQVIVGKHTGIDCLNPINAAFIVRACNSHEAMLDALKEAVCDGRLQTFKDRERFRKAARAAIAKAERRG